jgi:glycerate kinase
LTPSGGPLPALVAPDSFKGTFSAPEVARAVADGLRSAGREAHELPVADGGEGTMEVLVSAVGGEIRRLTVPDPLGRPVEAGFALLPDGSAVVEMAQASGLSLVPEQDRDAWAASTRGTGELIAAAVDAGCRRIVVGVGGSASTDGGLGAVRALEPLARLRGVELVVACDVRTRFVDAAPVFAPQKGASAAQVELLRRRLERLADVYLHNYGVDVRALEGSGAAGGLAGGLAVAGARLVPGFDLVADEVDLHDRLEGADLVVTGEGFLDEQSFEGKVVGGVAGLAAGAGVPVLAVVGRVLDGVAVPDGVEVVSLVDTVGEERAVGDTASVVEEAVAGRLRLPW